MSSGVAEKWAFNTENGGPQGEIFLSKFYTKRDRNGPSMQAFLSQAQTKPCFSSPLGELTHLLSFLPGAHNIYGLLFLLTQNLSPKEIAMEVTS